MNRNSQPNKSNSSSDIWREFVQAELKNKSKLGTLLESSVYGGYENKCLTIYFSDDNLRKNAQGQLKVIQTKLENQFRLVCDRIYFKTASAPVANITPQAINMSELGNPLQALYWTEAKLPDENDEVERMKILKDTVTAEKNCQDIYKKLRDRTLKLVDNQEENTLKVTFNWRLRVGGTRGFRELLLPVLHPVFGIPYIPASTLKGAACTWAKKHGASAQICDLLGMLEGKNAKAAKVEFLDAFPIKPCLSIDVATPQWSWERNVVKYQPVPHAFLSLFQPEFLIGLRLTAQGKSDKNLDKNVVQTVKEWLENALLEGIGSRVSSGYGLALLNKPNNIQSSYESTSYEFELWTQGMYGYNPPSRANGYKGDVEFRPSAIRGILRYWFRAVALSLYDISTCQSLESLLFGELGKQGKISIATRINPSPSQEPYCYRGRIYLTATETKYLLIAEQLLILASHLGGVGRGSRRPLHLLNKRMRGCHWEVTNSNLPLAYNERQWKDLFTNLKTAFQQIKSSTNNYTSSPSKLKQRHQDVLDKNAQVWLVKSPNQIPPQKVKNWQTEGTNANVKGTALDFFYGDTRFKGMSNGTGNANVGGALGTPSFVWIKSIFPYQQEPYQVVTIFGCDHPDRLQYAQELDKLRKSNQAILVFG
ncbi:RAMP superfamily CRISPR-associated protein [Calothrix sp. NIES-3974]|uniref:RAMP superfamily CRISPR-associated protein n=1 Tax=Calothrix sp. NIES-3974 TaxID=2005462 RepID=UPI000B621888|nr:RAMP superfamily CRISPR-associated protein [Calothrix sp. NIES-3974]BAZ04395.1 Cmr6 family CRISPR-associated RAMP protein [Calothrix sp. NIES-3974]